MFESWKQLEYHKEQAALWACDKRFVYVPAGRQSGKTELALRRLVAYLPVKQGRPAKYIYGGPTYAQAKRTAWQRLLDLIPPQWIIPNGISKGDLTIETIFGSTLYVFGFDKPQRVEGLTGVDGCVIDECSDIKPGTFDLSILPTMVWSNGWCWFIGIPKRFGCGAMEYRTNYEKAVRGELPDSAGFCWPSEGIVPSEYLELCREKMDERDFAEQFNAKWLNAGGGVFHAFDREFNVRPCAYNPELPLIVGSDFNVDPMAWVIGQRKGNTLEILDELFLRNTNTEAALQILLSRYGQHKGGFEMYGDASSRARKTSASHSDYVQLASNGILKTLGRTLHYSTSNPPVADRFSVTNAHIRNGLGMRQLFVDPKCAHLILDLETRAYVPGTRDVKDTGDSGHSTDALGYIIWKLWPLQLEIQNRQVITLRKGV